MSDGNGDSDSISASLADLVDGLASRLQAGERIDLDAVLREHADHATELRRLFPVLAEMGELSHSGDVVGLPADSGPPLAGTLGDFRILREVGRGGMGVVYEAEQVSLGRRVALKVLPFVAAMDSAPLQRFHNEARAAASLHHEHIVPVHAVGSERGIHYYAMQFVEGQTLAQFIARCNVAGEPTAPHGADAQDTTPRPAATDAPRDRAYFRRVAEWGVQAAEALEHAHSMGVVHRDVKPGNLMIDTAGKLWVTDFGLARMGAEGNLTMTGQVVGTLRYVSPEQASAKHGLVDHRTDVYALGVTLYELLTGRPAVVGKDQAEILREIAFEEPRPPRSLDRTIPADLETVTLAAMAKEPAGRYATAADLAADLRRWLADRPIQARRPSLAERGAKWLRRHRGLAAGAVGVLLLAAVGLAISTALIAAEQAQTRKESGEKDKALIAKTQALTDKDAALLQVTREKEKAENNLAKALELAPGETTLANRLLAEGKRNEAFAGFDRVHDVLLAGVETFPRKELYRLQLWMLALQVTDALETSLEYARAARYAATRIRILEAQMDPAAPEYNPEMQKASTDLVDAYSLRLRMLVADGQYQEAERVCADFRKAVLRHETSLRALSLRDFEYEPEFLLATLEITLGTIQAETGRHEEAETSYRTALDRLARVKGRLEDSEASYDGGLVVSEVSRAYAGLAEVHLAAGRPAKAQEAIRAAPAALKHALAESERARIEPPKFLPLARLLAQCPQLRDVEKAWALLPPKHSRYADCSAVGAVQFARGRDKEARDALNRAVELSFGGGAADWFYLAMLEARQKNHKAARAWYDKAVKWMDDRKHGSFELKQLRSEAAALLDTLAPKKP